MHPRYCSRCAHTCFHSRNNSFGPLSDMGAAVSRCSDDAMGAVASRCIDGADDAANQSKRPRVQQCVEGPELQSSSRLAHQEETARLDRQRELDLTPVSADVQQKTTEPPVPWSEDPRTAATLAPMGCVHAHFVSVRDKTILWIYQLRLSPEFLVAKHNWQTVFVCYLANMDNLSLPNGGPLFPLLKSLSKDSSSTDNPHISLVHNASNPSWEALHRAKHKAVSLLVPRSVDVEFRPFGRGSHWMLREQREGAVLMRMIQDCYMSEGIEAGKGELHISWPRHGPACGQ